MIINRFSFVLYAVLDGTYQESAEATFSHIAQHLFELGMKGTADVEDQQDLVEKQLVGSKLVSDKLVVVITCPCTWNYVQRQVSTDADILFWLHTL